MAETQETNQPTSDSPSSEGQGTDSLVQDQTQQAGKISESQPLSSEQNNQAVDGGTTKTGQVANSTETRNAKNSESQEKPLKEMEFHQVEKRYYDTLTELIPYEQIDDFLGAVTPEQRDEIKAEVENDEAFLGGIGIKTLGDKRVMSAELAADPKLVDQKINEEVNRRVLLAAIKTDTAIEIMAKSIEEKIRAKRANNNKTAEENSDSGQVVPNVENGSDDEKSKAEYYKKLFKDSILAAVGGISEFTEGVVAESSMKEFLDFLVRVEYTSGYGSLFNREGVSKEDQMNVGMFDEFALANKGSGNKVDGYMKVIHALGKELNKVDGIEHKDIFSTEPKQPMSKQELQDRAQAFHDMVEYMAKTNNGELLTKFDQVLTKQIEDGALKEGNSKIKGKKMSAEVLKHINFISNDWYYRNKIAEGAPNQQANQPEATANSALPSQEERPQQPTQVPQAA